ncbi:MAG TPA: 30S ribosomal protein S1 [Terriglobia bacterium]|nr:30S ribosomal protein S1 [Terriglobia bacterium]
MSVEENASAFDAGSSSPEAQTGAEKEEMGEAGDLFAGMQELPEVSEGKILRGTVLKITDDEVLIDIGQKSEGAIPRSEFLREDGSLSVAPGDVIDVQIESYDETEDTFTVSHRKAARLKVWEEIEASFRDQTDIRGRVVERTKGGLIVDVGVRAFLPGSQADLRPLRNLDSLIGQEIACKIIKLNKARNNLVLSRKVTLEEEVNRKKSRLLDVLREGAQLVGHVKNVTDYGAFVDLGGMDGLLHITDLAWGRVTHASEVLQVGQEVNVKVLKYDPEKGRVSLGMKQLAPDPWEQVSKKYEIGQRLTGRIVSIMDYGAFVEIEPGVEGLIHVSEMAWSRRMKHPSKIVKVGEIAEVVILEIHGDQRRISLSLKRSLPDPWTTLNERYSAGMTVDGRVRNLTDFGAFVEIEDGVDALIHISDLSWNKNVKHPSEVLKKGQRVQGVILSLDPAKRRISLGFKQLQPDAWEDFFAKVKVGTPIQGKVVRVAQFGAFVELQEGVEGLCHVSEIDGDHAANGSTPLEPGREYRFQVVRVDPAEKRVGLSLKALVEMRDPTSTNVDGGGVAAPLTITPAAAPGTPVESPSSAGSDPGGISASK